MPSTQAEKAQRFRELHERPGFFVFPNPWDGVSARILQGMGFEALATSSGAIASTLGRRDGQISRDESLFNARVIVESTDLPVAADLEKGFADDPEGVAECIQLAAEVGLVGGSIEDATGNREAPIFAFDIAVARVAAAVEAARKLPFEFTLTARTENFFRGNPDLDDTIARLKAFEAAGADVLFAPGLPDLASVRAVCQAVSKPVNYMQGVPGRSFSAADLAAAGVKRISLATSLYRTAMSALIDAATEARDEGTFTYVDATTGPRDMNQYLR
ncbi:MAG: isocitrate lyase/phosphoenolpyruvate mutase family protein [bacterium]